MVSRLAREEGLFVGVSGAAALVVAERTGPADRSRLIVQ